RSVVWKVLCSEISRHGGHSDDPSCIEPARKPRHVAEILAELMNGKYFPFSPVEGAFMAASGRERHAVRGLPGGLDVGTFLRHPANAITFGRECPHLAVRSGTLRGRRLGSGALRTPPWRWRAKRRSASGTHLMMSGTTAHSGPRLLGLSQRQGKHR